MDWITKDGKRFPVHNKANFVKPNGLKSNWENERRIDESIKGKPSTSSMIEFGRGLRPLHKGKIPIRSNVAYYMGASSSPDHIVVKKVEPDMIHYTSYPYKNDLRVGRDVGEDLIRSGMNTRKKSMETHYPDHDWSKEQVSQINHKLEGNHEHIKPTNYKDLQKVDVIVKLKKPLPIAKTKKQMDHDQQMWYHAEKYGGVGGLGSDDKPDERGRTKTIGYELIAQRGQLKAIKNDPLWTVESIKEQAD